MGVNITRLGGNYRTLLVVCPALPCMQHSNKAVVKKQPQIDCRPTTKKGKIEGPRTHIVRTMVWWADGATADREQDRDDGRTNSLCAVAHISSGNMEKIKGSCEDKRSRQKQQAVNGKRDLHQKLVGIFDQSTHQSARQETEENEKKTLKIVTYVRFSSISSQQVTGFGEEKEGTFKN